MKAFALEVESFPGHFPCDFFDFLPKVVSTPQVCL